MARTVAKATTNKHLSCCIHAKNVQLPTDNGIALWTKLRDTRIVRTVVCCHILFMVAMPQHKLANGSGLVIDP